MNGNTVLIFLTNGALTRSGESIVLQYAALVMICLTGGARVENTCWECNRIDDNFGDSVFSGNVILFGYFPFWNMTSLFQFRGYFA